MSTATGPSLLPLAFHKAIVTELLADDSALVVLARGLGTSNLIRFFVHSFALPTCLVFILDAGRTASPDRSLFDDLPKDTNPCYVQSFTADTLSSHRQAAYLKGGVFLVTARILVVDFLQNKVPLHLVTGSIVRNAERVTPTSTEAFCLRLLKSANEVAFIRAFSEFPERLVGGISKLGKIMSALQLRKLLVWPRFHITVSESLTQYPVDTVEIHVSMTPHMLLAQVALFEIITACIAEYRPLAPTELAFESLDGGLGLPGEEESVDSYVTTTQQRRRKKRRATEHASKTLADAFINHGAHAIGIESKPVGYKAKSLFYDLHLLRRLLDDLTELDAISFLNYLEAIYGSYARGMGSFFNNQHESSWIMSNAASQLMSACRDRVFRPFTGSFSCDPVLAKIELECQIQATLEVPPKWLVLKTILAEIKCDFAAKLNHHIDDQGVGIARPGHNKVRVLILCRETKIAKQLMAFLQSGGDDSVLKTNFKEYLIWSGKLKRVTQSIGQHSVSSTEPQPPLRSACTPVVVGTKAAKRRRVRDLPDSSLVVAKSHHHHHHHSDWQQDSFSKDAIERIIFQESTSDPQTSEIDNDAEESSHILEHAIPLEDAHVDLFIRVPLGTDEDEQLLPKLNPQVIILYDAMATMVRRIEVYQAVYCPDDIQLRTYFMTYKESIEEQKYLASIRREREAFERVIKSYASTVVPITNPGHFKHPHHDEAEIYYSSSVAVRNAAATGLDDLYEPRTVIVDVREFRASLPGELHLRKLLIVPCTLTVGDYVLAPDVVVERKSYSDLTQSLVNGRLYSQVKAMCLHYKLVLILIEIFDKSSLTLFQGNNDSTQVSKGQESIASKLVLLTVHYPQVRLLWSNSPSMSADLMEEIKRGRKEPNEDESIAKGNSSLDNLLVQSNMLRVLPGLDNPSMEMMDKYPTLLSWITNCSDHQQQLPLLTRFIQNQYH